MEPRWKTIAFMSPERSYRREKGADIFDIVEFEKNHAEPIDPHCGATGGRHIGKGREERFIEIEGGFAERDFFLSRPLEPGALFRGIGQFPEGISQFQTAEVQFPSFGDTGIGGRESGKRGGGGGVINQDAGAISGEGWLDDEGHIEIETVRIEGFDWIPTGVSAKRFAHGDFNPFAKEIEFNTAKSEYGFFAIPEYPCGILDELFGIVEDGTVSRLCAIPFQHCKFRSVVIASFAFAKARTQGVDFLHAGGKQLFHLQLGGGSQEGISACRRPDMRLIGGSRDSHGRLHFHNPLAIECRSQGGQDFCAERQCRQECIGNHCEKRQCQFWAICRTIESACSIS